VAVIVETTDSISCSEAKVVLVGTMHAIFCIYFQSGISGRKSSIGSSRKRNRIGSASVEKGGELVFAAVEGDKLVLEAVNGGGVRD